MNMVEKLAEQGKKSKEINDYAEKESLNLMDSYIKNNSRLVELMERHELVSHLKLTIYPILMELDLPHDENNGFSRGVAHIVDTNAIRLAEKIKG